MIVEAWTYGFYYADWDTLQDEENLSFFLSFIFKILSFIFNSCWSSFEFGEY